MRITSIITILILLFFKEAVSQNLSFDEKFFESASVFYKKSSIPGFIKKEFKKSSGYKIKMANPGKKYQASDVRSNPFLPTRRLICLIKAPSTYILFYEHGGRGKHKHCIVFKMDGRKVEKVISLSVSPMLPSYEELRAALLNNKYSELSQNSCRF